MTTAPPHALDCLNPEMVVAFVAGELSAAHRQGVEEHISRCEDCRQLVSAMVRERALARARANESARSDSATASRSSTPARDSDLHTPVALIAERAHPQAALFALGRDVGHYRIERFVGDGGMGRVFAARDMRLGRRVAIKVIHPQLVRSREAVLSFLAEARATAALSHPGIVAIHDLGEHGGLPYVVLEYVEGQTLRQLINAADIEPRRAVSFARDIAEALQEAHRRGILHRDLKPSNVMVSAEGRVRVLDFGLAQAVEAEEPMPAACSAEAPEMVDEHTVSVATAVGVIAGTPLYMAPEQWAGAAGKAADVWAFGLLVRELLGGGHPYGRLTLGELQRAVSSDEPVPPWPEQTLVPRQLCALVDACLHKEPGLRPSMHDVEHMLRNVTWSRRNRHAQSWLTLAVLLVLGGTAALTTRDQLRAALWGVFGRSQAGPVRAGSREASHEATRASTGSEGPPSTPSRPPSTSSGRSELPGSAASSHNDRVEGVRTPARNRPGARGSARRADVGRLSLKGRRRPHRSSRHGALERYTKAARPAARATDRQPQVNAAPSQFTLTVQSTAGGTPMWADVYLDGTHRGQTPLVLRDLAAGPHELRVVREGFVPEVRTVVAGGSRTLRLSLTLERK